MTKFTIIASEKDEAGKNIFKHIYKNHPSLSHYLIKEDSIHAEHIDKKIPGDFLIFATKHKSEQERKTLSIHAPGNWKKAEYGGKENTICKTSAFFLKHLFQTLSKKVKEMKSDYETTLEVTHHGPYIEKPCCFIEIGTTEKQWKDEQAGRIIARTIKKAVTSFKPEELKTKWKPAIGIGSPHYCPNFNKIQLNSDFALSHIIPQYAFPIAEHIIKEAIAKTEEKIEIAILDWKGMKSEERQQIIKILGNLNLEYKRNRKNRKDRKIEK